MSNIKDKGKEYLGAGLSVVFLQESKLPNLSGWKDLSRQALSPEEIDTLFSGGSIRTEIVKEGKTKEGKAYSIKGFNFYPEKNPTYLGIIAGKVSGGLEVIDIDCKYDLTGSLWQDFKTLLEDNLGETFNSLVIAQTKSGGYHIYYRCSELEGNLKLANRPTTEKEREATYQENINSGKDEATAKRASQNDKVRVLIETRGDGGYVVAPPSKGYFFIQNTSERIPSITPQERACILAIARDFNQVEETPSPQVKKATSSPTPSGSGITSLEDYDQRGDAVELLKSHGWTEVGTSGERVNLLRPGETSAKSSGNYHTGKRCFISFSTSTQFEPGKPYSPSQIYNLLECGGDWSKTAKQLGDLGYGDKSYKGASTTKELKTERITVEAVNRVTLVNSVISSPGDSLKRETFKTDLGEEIVITSPGSEAQEEVIKAIQLAQGSGKRIYIKEGATEPIREYKYQLRALFDKYGAIQEVSGGLTDKETDNLLDEVIKISLGLEPIDRDIFKKDFLSLETIKELGITEESLSITLDRLTSTREKEAQEKAFKKLLSKATELQDKGDTKQALELLETKVKEVKLKDKATEFSSLVKPILEDELKERQANRPESLDSGYKIGGEALLLPAGAISIFTAPTSHGKTTFLINLALNTAKSLQNKEVYFFSYEEDGDSILINTLNTYLDQDLSVNNRKSLKSYFSTGSTEYFKSQAVASFETSKAQFFKELINTRKLNIHYSSYNSDTLIDAIRYLHKHAKPGAIFIDYIQLLNLPEGKYKTYSRQEEIKEICIALKDVAVETGLPIILGAQFNRQVVNQLKIHATNIGEAGDIERIANLIVGFWNNNFKPLASDGELSEIDKKGATTPDTLYTTILKNRGGRVGLEDILTFNGNTGRIKNSLPRINSGSSSFAGIDDFKRPK